MGHEAALLRHPAKYPVRLIEVTKLHVASGRRAVPANTLFTGQIPRRLVIGFVDMDAYYGNYEKSPFCFTGDYFDFNLIFVLNELPDTNNINNC